MTILITVLPAAATASAAVVVVVVVKVPPVLKHLVETSDIQVKVHLAFIGTVILLVILRIGC